MIVYPLFDIGFDTGGPSSPSFEHLEVGERRLKLLSMSMLQSTLMTYP
jgi:hypothetical protein